MSDSYKFCEFYNVTNETRLAVTHLCWKPSLAILLFGGG